MILKETALTSVLNRLKNLFSLKSKTVFSVNGEEPVNGDVTLREVPLAVNLSSDKTQESLGEFIIRTSGGSASISDGDAFALRILGNRVHTGYIPESLMMTVNAASRTIEDQPITAEIDRDTFVAYVSDSGTTTLTYTTEWSANPALYGITVTGTPVDGDEIVVVYVKENRGTITVANPTALKSTGWNLYNHTAGYAYATKYSDDYGFMIGGTYTAVKFATAPDAVEKTTITPVDGMFSIPSDGYIFVEGGNNTDTFIINVWSDWTDGPVGTFEAYSETEINFATIMQTYFANGLLRVGDVRDEINLNTATAISRINRMAYSAANLATAKASGRAYEYDTNYIYIVKAVFDVNDITLDGSYTASDRGNEFFTGTTIPVFIETLYGNNLKNKLERDVVTKSQDIVNNLTTNDATKALSAAMGKELNTILLGVKDLWANSIGITKDLNTLELGESSPIYGSSTPNRPQAISWGYCVCFGTGSYKFQVAYDITNASNLCSRVWDGSAWRSWVQITSHTELASVENGLAYRETGATASRNISNGEYVFWNGAMYKANGNIASGTTLVSGTNLTPTENALNALNGNIAAVQENASYYTLINQITLTTQYVTHSLYNGRKFSDYDLIVVTPMANSWARASSVMSKNTFTQLTGIDVRYPQGSSSDIIEVDVKYKSDTEIECKYIGNSQNTVYLYVYGLFKRYN